MATFNIEEGDEIENVFTEEMSNELNDLWAQNQADKTSLTREQLQRMLDLKTLHTEWERQELIDQMEQTNANGDGAENAEGDEYGEEDAGVRGAQARDSSDNWGVPPTKLRSTNTDHNIMSRIERKMREMVKNEFYAHYDSQTASSGRENFVKSPKTGINTMLSRSGENVWKVRTRNMNYGGPSSKTHDLAHCLAIHREISEKAALTSDASIDLLKRILQGEPFKLCQNLHRGKCNIDRIYVYLQKTFQGLTLCPQGSTTIVGVH